MDTVLLRAPLTLPQVAELVRNVATGFYRQSDTANHEAENQCWDSNDIDQNWDTIEELAQAAGVALPDRRGRSMENILETLQFRAGEIMITVDTRVQFRSHWSSLHDDIRNRILNATLLADIIRGQTMPSSVNDFVIGSSRLDADQDWFDDYIRHRNQMIHESAARIRQSATGAAVQIMRDLR